MAQENGISNIYVSTYDPGLFEKYGFTYMENRIDINRRDSRIYCRSVNIEKPLEISGNICYNINSENFENSFGKGRLMSEIILKAENIMKTYGKGESAVHALNDVSLEVEKGEFLAIVGQSGSGKSTLLHILGAMDYPDSGRLTVDGEDVFSMNDDRLAEYRRRKAGFVFQFFNLLPVMTAKENILIPLSLDGKTADNDYLMDLAETMGIDDRLSHYPHQLSGGQQQRVAIARAMIAKPAVILADEPTGNLDSASGEEILSLLKKTMQKYGQTLILITHDMSIAAKADRTVTIKDGRISG